MIKIFFQEFFGMGLEDVKILGFVKTYFNVIKSNGREMFYLYKFVWFDGYHDFKIIGKQIVNNDIFRYQIINYIKNIIYIDINLEKTKKYKIEYLDRFKFDNNLQNFDKIFYIHLIDDFNIIYSERNIYRYRTIYYKYGKDMPVYDKNNK